MFFERVFHVKRIVDYSVNRAITIFMAVLIIIVFGVVSITNLTTDLFPSINIPYAVVVTTYPGASPLEVEDVVTKPLEETLATTTNIKQLRSTSQENLSTIILEFTSNANMDSAVIEMRENLDLTASDFPDMVSQPRIIKLNPDMMPVMQLSVTEQGVSQQELTNNVKQDVLPQVERIPGVASVSLSGAYESEIQVTLDDAAITQINSQLRTLFTNMGIDEKDMLLIDRDLVSNILMAQNFEFPVGFTQIEGVNYLVRVGDEFKDIDEIRDMKIFNFQGIPNVINPIIFTLDDIADVQFVNANEKQYSKVNGEDAITFSIQKNSEFATTDVTGEINQVLKNLNENNPDLKFTVLFDQGDYIDYSVGNVTSNLIYGAVLAIIVLLLFLRSVRATTIVALSIPISVMFAVVLIYFSGITLNIVSMGGLALGIGMLVDNSIVVIENIYRLRKEGVPKKEAALQGAKQVAGAVTASTITTISVFIPVLFIEGFIKEIFLQMALTIAYSLTASLFIALTLVPAISSKILDEGTKKDDHDSFLQKARHAYQEVLLYALRVKGFVLAIVVVLFVGSIWLAKSNGLIYFPESDEGQISISITNPVDSPLNFDEFITVIDDISNDLIANKDVDVVGSSLGSAQGAFFGIQSTNNATINVVLKDERIHTTKEMEGIFKDLLSQHYDMIDYDVAGSQQQTSMLTGSGMQVEIRGYDLDVLKTQSKEISEVIRGIDGVQSVDDGTGIPSDEIKITVDKDKATQYGLTTAQVLQIVSEKLAAVDSSTSVTIGGDIYDVYVYDNSTPQGYQNLNITDLENLIIGQNMLNPTELIQLSDIATVATVKGFTSINHVDGVRTITVDVQYKEDANVTFVAQNIENAILNHQLPEGYDYKILGENEEVNSAMNTLLLAVVLGILLIYMVMASQFQSLSYPFIIMFTIPLAFTGGFFILYFANMPISVVAAIGFVMLTGIVVNNGIVLVDYINQLRERGMELEEAIVKGGQTRLRPIIMTALTTILALTTMAIGIGKGSEMLQPMAVTTIGGLIYATLLTLIVVPIMYYLMAKNSKEVLLVFITFITAITTIVLYVLYSYWYIIPLGVLFTLMFITLYIIRRKKDHRYV
jgi:HAE1 family hydrophobic/amphiphilic exporter-1